MKKILLSIAMCITVTVVSAQTVKKPIVKQVEVSAQDTLNLVQSYKDLAIRASLLYQLMYIIQKPGDVTPNQAQALLKGADSVARHDQLIYTRNEAEKQKLKTPVKPPVKP